MDHSGAQGRGEEKARLILDQVGAIRARLNALALQKGLFGGLTLLLCAVALIVGGAFVLGPIGFLLVGAAVVVAGVAGVARTARGAWRMRMSDERAARVADQRAALKGRLTTLVDASRVRQRSALWPYLVEDILALQGEFVAARIEPRRISRWLWAALASCAAAALVMHLAYHARVVRLAAQDRLAAIPGEPSVDIGDLDIRRADPSAQADTQIDADPATLRKLAEKLRDAQRGGGRSSPTSRLMANARDMASALQNRLTGGSPPAATATRLKLTDKKGGGSQAAHDAQNPDDRQTNGGRENSQDSAAAGDQPGQDQPPQPDSGAPPGMPDMSGQAALNGLNSDEPEAGSATAQKTPPDARRLAQGGALGSGGPNHGSGSDPRHLFGEADTPPLGNDTFKIPVEVGPSDEGSSAAAPVAQPRHVRSALNAQQAPDQPFERASIPASDRVTIQRVFER